MFVENVIENEIYEKLMDYAFKKCDAVMFIFRKDMYSTDLSRNQLNILNKKMTELKYYFKDDILKIRNSSHWAYSKVSTSKESLTKSQFEKMFEIIFLKTNEKVKNYLLSNKNMYNWLHPYYPEDLSFFKNGYCWLSTVSHEQECFINCNEKEFVELKEIGLIPIDKKSIKIEKSDVYYEKY